MQVVFNTEAFEAFSWWHCISMRCTRWDQKKKRSFSSVSLPSLFLCLLWKSFKWAFHTRSKKKSSSHENFDLSLKVNLQLNGLTSSCIEFRSSLSFSLFFTFILPYYFACVYLSFRKKKRLPIPLSPFLSLSLLPPPPPGPWPIFSSLPKILRPILAVHPSPFHHPLSLHSFTVKLG